MVLVRLPVELQRTPRLELAIHELGHGVDDVRAGTTGVSIVAADRVGRADLGSPVHHARAGSAAPSLCRAAPRRTQLRNSR